MLRDNYDVIISGGGPAGSVAALRAAEAGFSVLLCEKRTQVGIPVRCGELAGYKKDLERFIPADPAFITAVIAQCEVVSPSGTVYTRKTINEPVILDREVFDVALFNRAASAGAHALTSAEITNVTLGGNGNAESVAMEQNGVSRRIGCGYLIGADGVESSVGRLAGLSGACPLSEIYSCFEYRISGYEGPSDSIRFFIGRKLAPHGYIWVFPRRKGEANVGIALVRTNRNNGHPPKAYLDSFMAVHFPGKPVIAISGGGIPIDAGLKSIARRNMVLIGDAAHHANPFSGGGIMNAMEDADLLVRLLVKSKRKHGKENLARYRGIYFRKQGWILKWQRAARRLFYGFNDATVEKLFRVVDRALGTGDVLSMRKLYWASVKGFIRSAVGAAPSGS